MQAKGNYSDMGRYMCTTYRFSNTHELDQLNNQVKEKKKTNLEREMFTEWINHTRVLATSTGHTAI